MNLLPAVATRSINTLHCYQSSLLFPHVCTTALNSVSHAVKLHSYLTSISTQFITKILHTVPLLQWKLIEDSVKSTYPLMMFEPHSPPWILVKLLGLIISIPRFLSTVLHHSIYHLFCESISHGQLPTEWKIHRIIPIFKCDDRSQANNYRPISLLCIISKVLEWIVYDHIIEFLFSSISIYQFGFVSGCSSLQQPLIFVDILLQAKENKAVADIIHLYIRKAFDSVSHHKLLVKTPEIWYLQQLTEMVSRISCQS